MFLLDTNVFLEAKNRYYGFDFAPGFWSWLDTAFERSLICSVKHVQDELSKHDDEIATWVRQRGDFFKEIDQQTAEQFTPLSQWAASREFRRSAILEFTPVNADFLLIAYAKAHDHTVVTLEKPSNSKKNVKIPDACAALDVPIINTFDMLRRTGARLISEN